jgi:glycosyltransferase involved in cell wall biosynthesis
MAAGLPVIASNVGGIPYAIAHGVTGLLAPMGDAAAWAAAIEQLLGDTRRAHAIGALAQQVAAARFSRERMIAGIERELQAIAGR